MHSISCQAALRSLHVKWSDRKLGPIETACRLQVQATAAQCLQTQQQLFVLHEQALAAQQQAAAAAAHAAAENEQVARLAQQLEAVQEAAATEVANAHASVARLTQLRHIPPVRRAPEAADSCFDDSGKTREI